ncbi:MAG: NAD(P)-binding protein [Bacteroidetes bacterium]|nr:MAG: NAD(P)-binding protein [Bacteroidota bacterium]
MAKQTTAKKGTPTASKKVDVAVIGGGVAGAYSAWRLQKANGKKSKVALYEYSDRIGGRLFSRTLPGMPNVVAELGGMRYIPETQPLVTGLINYLKLPTKDFPMGNPDPEIGASQNYYYLRGEHLTLEELSIKGAVPYNLSWSEQGMNPDQLQAYVMNVLVPNAKNLTLEDWFKVEVFGTPLYKMGYWNLLNVFLTNEAFSYMRDAGGYDANVANASAVAQLPVSDFGPTTSFRTLTKGYQDLPLTLAEQFEADGGEINMNHKLLSIKRLKNGEYELVFTRTKTQDFKTHYDNNSDERIVVHADKIILAMPRRSLELIEWDQWQENEFLKNNVGSVLIQHAFKLFMGYDYPWWRALNLWAGRSITDMPIRQVYYFGCEGDQPGADPNNTKSLLMASYNDISTVPFWKALQNDEPYGGNDKPENKSIDPVPPAQFVATQSMVEIAHKQVETMHGQQKLDMPYAAIFHDWSEDPYGGGWHEWKAGYRYDEIIKKMVKPVEDQDVFIIGEAYSNNQGWVEGSLETAEDMMKRYFKLDYLPRK